MKDICPRCGQKMNNPDALYCLNCALEDLEVFHSKLIKNHQNNKENISDINLPSGYWEEFDQKLQRQLKRGVF